MTDDKSPLNDVELDALFAGMRSVKVAPSSDLMARVLADAEMAADRQEAAEVAERAAREVPAQRTGWFSRVLAGVGGMPSAAGLAGVVVVGIGLGLNPPALLETLEASYFGLSDVYVLDMVPDLQGDLIDG